MNGGLPVPPTCAGLSHKIRAWTHRSARGVALCAVLAWIGAVQGDPSWQTPGRPDAVGGYSSSQIVVKLSPDARDRVATMRGRGLLAPTADPRSALSESFRAVSTNWRVSQMRPAYPDPFGDPALARNHGLDRTYIIEVPVGTDTPSMATAFAAILEDVELATVDGVGGVAQFIPDDPSFDLLYGLHNWGQVSGSVPDADIDAPEAWEIHTGDFGTVTIAIIDSGVDSHTEFGTNAPPYPNGRIVQGRNTADPERPTLTTDDCPHGTHIAGIAAAAGNNGVGVAGVTWGAYIMPIRVLDTFNPCGGDASALAAGIVWAADNGADIANISLQYNLNAWEAQTVQDAVNYGHDRGMLIIAAAGNGHFCGGAGTVCYPARNNNCMAISATTDEDVIATDDNADWASNWGSEIELSAPGDDIYSTWTGGSYTYKWGTSMAAPHVSGLAALIKSYAPDATNEDIRQALLDNSDDLGPAGWDDHYGHGRINAHEAPQAFAPPPIPAASDWGLVSAALAALTAGTLIIMRRRRSAST